MSSPAKLMAVVLICACGSSAAPKRPRGPVAMTLESVDGGNVDIASYRGRVVVIHVFATWATTAHTDVEQLAALHEGRPRDVVVVGLSYDQDRHFIAPWRHAVGARYVVALASEDIRRGDSPLGQVREVPATFVLDRRGRLAKEIHRPLQPGELEPIVSKLLSK